MPLPAFEDVRFPIRIAFGASGGPERRNEIVPLSDGTEQRNARRRHARRRYDVGTGVRSLDDLREVVAFFEARRGSLTAFRFSDPLDDRTGSAGSPSANDERLGTGDGERVRFPLLKRYGDGDNAYERIIALPRPDTVRVAVDGLETDFMLEGGEVVFESAPVDGASVTAGFAFDLPVRFDTEHLNVSITAFEAGEVPSIPLIEVRR